MRLFEFDYRNTEVSLQRYNLLNFLEKRGYTYQGQGSSAAVFAPSAGNYLVKVYGTDRDDDVSWNYDPLKFYRLCKKINNQFVPRFGTPKKITVSGVEYIVLPTEKLSHSPVDENIREYEEDLLYTPLNELIEENPDIADLVKKHGIKTFQGLYETVDKICEYGDCEDLDNPGGANVMYRGNIIVINDPWAYTNSDRPLRSRPMR